MDLRERIKGTLLDAMAKVFELDRAALETRPDLNSINDLGATSIQFFPIISALEDELDIELQYQDFRRNGKTIQTAIDFVVQQYEETYG